MNIKRPLGIQILERAGDIQLSKEQYQIVKQPYSRPTLINACAGSGKTTMLLFKVMLDILVGDYRPSQITCLTFSRRACKSMKDRYQQILKRLANTPYVENFRLNSPIFKTFDSWFLQLLRLVDEVNVIPGAQVWSTNLQNAIVKESAVEDRGTQLDNIFACYDYLINNNLTTNGLYQPGHDQAFKHFRRTQLSEYQRGDPNFLENYQAVVNQYNQLKAEYQKTDFNDIKVKLLQALQDPVKKRKILMNTYLISELFIDEFQDTNNVQWKIVNLLLSKNARQHLSVIGDDDQAIYAFRGSNPGLILNFQQIFPNAQVFNLSTNYRTAGNILNAVKPSITKDQWRLPKELHSSRPGKGEVYSFTRAESSGFFAPPATGNSPKHRMFRHLKYQLDHRDPHETIAVLVRTNIYKALTVDELASVGYFVSPSKASDILQNKPIYRSCFHLFAAFVFNNFLDFYDESQRIGFRTYRNHIQQIINEYHLRPWSKFHLSTYFSLAKVHNRVVRQDIKRNPNYGQCRQERRAIQLDQKAEYILNYVQKMLAAQKDGKQLIHKLGEGILNLTSAYYHYMFKKHFISVNLTRQSLDYFKNLISYYNSLSSFFNGENYKRTQLMKKFKDHNQVPGTGRVQVMTIHQAKGLQFDRVYLVGLSTSEVQPADVEFNHYFAPNITPDLFVRKLLIMQPSKLNHLDSQLTKKQLKQMGRTGSQIQRILKDLGYYYCQSHATRENQLTVEQIIYHLANQTLAAPDLIRSLQKSLRTYYNLVRDKSYTVEQERHLQYVGATRAKKGLYYDTETNNSPLLNELNIKYIKNIYQ